MTTYEHHIRYITLAILFIVSLTIQAQHRTYDNQHPVVIVGDWDKPPYEYQNDRGEPAGSNIDVMRAIMKQLDIPCKFVLKEWGNAIKAFERGEADLILANASRYRKAPYYITQNVINYNRIRALTLGDSVPTLSLKQMVEEGVVLRPSDYSLAYFLSEDSSYLNHIEFQSPKVALLGIREGYYKYFVWGEEPLKWKIREFSVEQEGLVLNEVHIPVSQIHVIGRDQNLINSIDDVYSRLKQSGEVEVIKNRWLHPEYTSGIQQIPVSVYIILSILLLTIVCYLINRLAQSHVKRASRHSTELNEMMYKALHMGRFYVMQYDIARNHFTNHYGTFLPDKGMSLEEFVNHIHPTEQEEFMDKMNQMLKGRERKTAINKRWNVGSPEQPQWLNFSGHSMVEFDDEGHPAYIINTINDITQDIEEEKNARNLVRKYERLSNLPQISMSFYNQDGIFIDLNDSMKALCHFEHPDNERYFRQSNMFDIPVFRDLFPRGNKSSTMACHHMEMPENTKDTYIEFDISPLTDEQGKTFNYIISVIDITEEHDLDKDLHKMNQEILSASRQINLLERQLQYILESTNMYVWQLNFPTQTVTYTRRLKHPEYIRTFKEYYDCVYEEEKASVKKGLESPELWAKPFSLDRHFKKPLVGNGDSDRWYNISGIPTYDTDGKIIGTFGILLDITDRLKAEHKLKEETLRAENSGKQKSMFLASMTHELRTPLNSIVGFSDLLGTIEATEERKEFIRIIHTNCEILIRLINDILEASNLSDTQMQIVPQEIDFAKAFDNMCQTLERRVDNPNVQFIRKSPFTKLITTLDKDRIQQVVTNFLTNAVKYTHEGHITVGYRLEQRDGRQGLYVYCEDTGTGIPAEKKHAIFERFVKLNEFVQGTGLGLAICKNIIECCNGQIDVDSQEGEGSTFWFWIPVELKDIDPTPLAFLI